MSYELSKYELSNEEYLMIFNDDSNKYIEYILNGDKIELCELTFRNSKYNNLHHLCYFLRAWKIMKIILLRGCKTSIRDLLILYDNLDEKSELYKLTCNEICRTINDCSENGIRLDRTINYMVTELVKDTDIPVTCLIMDGLVIDVNTLPTITTLTLDLYYSSTMDFDFRYITTLILNSSKRYAFRKNYIMNLPAIQNLTMIEFSIDSIRGLPSKLKRLHLEGVYIYDSCNMEIIVTDHVYLLDVVVHDSILTIYTNDYKPTETLKNVLIQPIKNDGDNSDINIGCIVTTK